MIRYRSLVRSKLGGLPKSVRWGCEVVHQKIGSQSQSIQSGIKDTVQQRGSIDLQTISEKWITF